MNSANYESILKPFSSKRLSIPNRIFFSSMGIDQATTLGEFSYELSQFYKEILNAECGYVMLGNTSVSRFSQISNRNLCLFNEKHRDSLKEIFTTYRNNGTLLGIQLQHYGHQGSPEFSKNGELLTPSGIEVSSTKNRFPSAKFQPASIDDIQRVRVEYLHSAKLAESAGAAFIQIQAANGYLLSSFISSRYNKRTDLYGGNPERRGRLLREIISDMRGSLISTTALTIRMGIDDLEQDPRSIARNIIDTIGDAEIDMIELSACTAEDFKLYISDPEKVFSKSVAVSKHLKSITHIPVAITGLVRSLATADALVSNGSADCIGMVRPLYADNEFIIKSVNGREDKINKCLNDGKCFMDKSNPKAERVYCCVNPKYMRPSHI